MRTLQIDWMQVDSVIRISQRPQSAQGGVTNPSDVGDGLKGLVLFGIAGTRETTVPWT